MRPTCSELQARHGVEAYQQLLESLDQLSWLNWELLRGGDRLQAERTD